MEEHRRAPVETVLRANGLSEHLLNKTLLVAIALKLPRQSVLAPEASQAPATCAESIGKKSILSGCLPWCLYIFKRKKSFFVLRMYKHQHKHPRIMLVFHMHFSDFTGACSSLCSVWACARTARTPVWGAALITGSHMKRFMPLALRGMLVQILGILPHSPDACRQQAEGYGLGWVAIGVRHHAGKSRFKEIHS